MLNEKASTRKRNVTDIIDLAYLQEIQDSLGRIVGITTALLDPDGVPVSQPTNLHAFCAMMQASESGVQMCMHANGQLIDINKKTKGPAVVTCPNSGLKTAAVPIFLGEEYLGSWLIGQIRMDKMDEQLIENTAKAAGLSKQEAKENFNSLPVISQEEFENILSFLTTITAALTDMVKINATLQEKNENLFDLTEKLDNSLHAFREFIDFSDIGAYLVDYHTFELIMYNEAYKNLFASTDAQLKHSSCYTHMQENHMCSFCPHDRLLDEDGNPGEAVVWEHYNDVAKIWLRITSRAIHWIDGRLCIMNSFIDITARKQEEQRIRYLAYHDQLLDIHNGPKLYEDLQSSAADNTYLICFDIEGMRKINDRYGREAGDLLLRQITDWLLPQENSDFNIYCTNGGNFVCLITNSSEQQAIKIAQSMYDRFNEAWTIALDDIQQKIYVGVHMGVINAPVAFESQSSLLNTIERVLSTARRDDELILFDEAMNEEFKRHLQFEISLKNCIFNDMQGFSLNYQPIVDVSSGNWHGLEALCRWNAPDFGPVAPDIFIHEVERIGLINTLSNWVFEEAISQVKKWGLDKKPDFILDVNLSPFQLKDRELLDKVVHLLEKYDYPANKLSMEITESAEISFDEKTLSLLDQIRSQGISLSLDDFGIGYATFATLKNLPVSYLKTDRSFAIGIENDVFLQHIIRIMVDLAHAAGILVIAEGVETELQRQIMQYSGVNYIQGYFYSRPLPAEELSQQLDNFPD